jgi:hypothetical protein
MAYIYHITTQVTLMKEETPLDSIKKLFMKKKVLRTDDVIGAARATSRMTAHRYLKKLDCLSSYTHARQFYTLGSIPEFDTDGLWHFGDISFSRHGTLIDSIIHLVQHSKNGRTNPELAKQLRVYAQNALLGLFKKGKIQRKELNGVYVYVSSDPEIALKQMAKRTKRGDERPLPDWIVVEVLVATIKSLKGKPNSSEVIIYLSQYGSSVTREQVEQVFEEHDLVKKTLD